MGGPLDLTLTLELETPLLVGGRRLGGADSPTLDHIPGGVLRAAVARAILEQCPYFDRRSPGPRRYWVEYKDLPACTGCPWRLWCHAFGQVRFGHAHPEGAGVLPQTALACKHEGERHPLADSLVQAIRLREAIARRTGSGDPPVLSGALGPDAPRCRQCGGRMERLEGCWDGGQRVSVPRTLLRRVGLDPWRHTAAEGVLYGLQVVRECHPDGKPVRFVAPIAFPDDGAGTPPVLPVSHLAVGARTSSGMGRCRVTLSPAAGPASGGEVVARRVAEFTRQVTEEQGRIPPAPRGTYVALTLETEAITGLRNDGRLPYSVTSAAFREGLARCLNLPGDAGWSLRHVFATYTFWGGWDTSRPGGVPKPQTLRIQRGSVLVLYHPAGPDEVALEPVLSLARLGLGQDVLNGYGRVTVCHPFHLECAQEG